MFGSLFGGILFQSVAFAGKPVTFLQHPCDTPVTTRANFIRALYTVLRRQCGGFLPVPLPTLPDYRVGVVL
jgi:hypothetical protein